MKPITQPRTIGLGDLVAHPQTQNKGIVTAVKNGMVKFRVFGRTGPSGAPIYRTFLDKKLVLMAKKDQIDAKYNEIVAAREVAAKRAQKPLYRLARWIGSKLPFKAAANPQPA